MLEFSREALAELRGPKRLEIIPGATHLFEERGALETVAQLPETRFSVYLGGPHRSAQTA